MIGLILNKPTNLYYSDLVKGFNPNTVILSDVYSSDDYGYEFMYGFTDDNVFSASAITQKLIDSGCSVIIYLGKCNSYTDDKVLNVINLVNPLIINRKPKFIKYSHENVSQGSLQCVTDSQDVIDRPYDKMSASIVNTCLLNNVQILMLLYQINKEDRSDEYIFNELGIILKDKLSLIMRTDYSVYDKSKKIIKNKVDSLSNSFRPVNKEDHTRFMNIPSKYSKPRED